MKPQNIWNIENTKEDHRTVTLSRFLKDVYSILLNGFTFKDNYKGTILTCAFTVANQVTTFSHGLAFVPTDYYIAGLSANMVIYEFTSNEKTISLKSSAVGTARIMVGG